MTFTHENSCFVLILPLDIISFVLSVIYVGGFGEHTLIGVEIEDCKPIVCYFFISTIDCFEV